VIGSLDYAYGDRDLLAKTALVMAYVVRKLSNGAPTTLGLALRDAKQLYFSSAAPGRIALKISGCGSGIASLPPCGVTRSNHAP